MGTEGETEVDDDGRRLDEGGDKQDWAGFVGGVCSEEVEGESVECYSGIFMRCKECTIHTGGPPYSVYTICSAFIPPQS